MSKNIAAMFGKQPRKTVTHEPVAWVLPDQLMGIEVEVEIVNGVVMPSEPTLSMWRGIRDGSLRNGREFILQSPQKGNALSYAIHELFDTSRFTRSMTGSTHIHVDMLEDGTSYKEVQMLVLLAYCLESAVFAIGDKGREWCGYTNKLCTAPDALIGYALNVDVRGDDVDFIRLCSGMSILGEERYYGLNLLSLGKHSSLEFRYFPTATSSQELIEWVQLVQSFKKAAMELSGRNELVSIFSNSESYESFITKYFNNWRYMFLQEVPQWMANASLQKALAVAGSMVAPASRTAFNPEVITKSKVFNKFVKKRRKKKASTGVASRILFITEESAPPATPVPTGTVLIRPGHIWIASPIDLLGGENAWIHVSAGEEFVCRGRLTVEEGRQVLNAVNSITMSQLSLEGFDEGARRTIMAKLAQLVVMLTFQIDQLRAAITAEAAEDDEMLDSIDEYSRTGDVTI